MSRAHLAALVAALAVGATAPRLAAQDTSSAATGQGRPDTSAYTGAGGVDTSARPGRVGADTLTGGTADTAGWTNATGDSSASDTARAGEQTPRKANKQRRLQPGGATGSDTMSAPARADADSTGPLGTSDSSGMRGRHPDSTHVGDTTSPTSGVILPSDTGSSSGTGASSTSSDTSAMDQPTTQPSQSTSPSGP